MKYLISSLVIVLGLLLGSAVSFVISPQLSPLNTLETIAENIQIKDSPAQLAIPKLGITVPIESLGKADDGRMDVPKNTNNAGWYNLGPVPGDTGNAVIAGHYDDLDGPSIFYNLGDLDVNDEVKVITQKGKELTFVVTYKAVYPDNNFPLHEVFGKANGTHLNLITCGGVFDKEAKNYSDRVVVFTQLKQT